MNSLLDSEAIVKFIVAVITIVLIYSGVNLGIDIDKGLLQSLQPTAPGSYRVTSVSDGDTFTVQMASETHEVRLVGVDTPETHHPRKPIQCYGPKASEFTTQLIEGKTVKLLADAKQPSRDKYDRLLRYVVLEDGRELNELLVSEGYAFATDYNTEKKLYLKALQLNAERQNKGLWGSCEVISPNGYFETAPL